MGAAHEREWTVIVTRPRERAHGLLELLLQYDIAALHLPLIATRRSVLNDGIREAAALLAQGSFDWLLFTSSEGAESFFELQAKARGSNELPSATRIGAVGQRTAGICEALWRRAVSCVPASAGGAGLAAAVLRHARPGASVLFAGAKETSGNLEQRLVSAGLELRHIAVYETIAVDLEPAAQAALDAIPVDGCVFSFFSPSAFAAARQTFGDARLSSAKIASIGPVTSRAIESQGFTVFFEAAEACDGAFVKGLAEALGLREGS